MSVLINEKLHSHLKHWHVSGFTHRMVDGGDAATD